MAKSIKEAIRSVKREARKQAQFYQGAALKGQRIEGRSQCREIRLQNRVVTFPFPNGEIVRLTCF